jgi:selenocysteine lyase/cysteine desulfurase
MNISRRKFVNSIGLASGAVLLAQFSCARRPIEPIEEKPKEILYEDDWEQVRRQFDLNWNYVHMSCFLLASHPKPVKQAIETHRHGLDENPVQYYRENSRKSEEGVRLAAASYLNTHYSQIALTDSTTMGLGLLYTGIKVRGDQEILTTEHEYYSTLESLDLRSLRTGATVRKISLHNGSYNTSIDELVGNIYRSISPGTRVIALTWVHSSTGLKIPVREIGKMVSYKNRSREDDDRILLCVDGVHGLGVENVNIEEVGCDFFVAGTHKWMFGPRGTGIFWGRDEAWENAVATVPTFSRSETAGQAMTPGGFHSFEHRWALNEAFDFHRRIGKEQVEKRIHQLNTQLKEGLRNMSSVTLHTPVSEELSAGLVCFEVDGFTPYEVVKRLEDRFIIATTTPGTYKERYVRLAPGLLNNPSEVERTLAAIREL